MKKTLGSLRKADEDWQLIKNGDKIAIGLSGGKDSMLMAYALSLYKKFSKKNSELVAVMVDLGFRPFDYSATKSFCDNLEIPLHVVESDIGNVVFNVRKEKNPCSLCAKMRKGALYDEIKKLGFNKVALGHHQDDLINTFFLSMLYEGRLNALKPIFYLSRVDLTVIRPLLYLPEEHIIKTGEKLNIPILESCCPANGNTKRDEVADLMLTLEKQYPDIKDKVFDAIYRKQNYQLWTDILDRLPNEIN